MIEIGWAYTRKSTKYVNDASFIAFAIVVLYSRYVD